MSRYIDIEPYEKDGWYLQKRYHNSYSEVIKTTPLNCVPTAEPIKHGRWEETEYSAYDDTYRCSACGEVWEFIVGTPKDNRANYCPNCGATMDLGEVEDDN